MVKKCRDVRIVERMADIDPVREVEAPEISHEGAEDHVQDVLRIRRHDVVLSAHAPLQQSKAKLHEEDESRGQNLQGGEIHARKSAEEEGGEIRYHEVPQARTSQDVSMSCSS